MLSTLGDNDQFTWFLGLIEPYWQESLADYIKRIRTSDGMTQFKLAQAAGIHSRSLGKIERGLTTRLNRKTLHGLAGALGIPQEYLEAVLLGEQVLPINSVKFCPQCWALGAVADPLWGQVRAKFCYLCGMQLQTSCTHCGELVVSLKYKFCPMCGKPYKSASQNR